MKIRRYTPEDRDQLASFWRRVFPEDPPHNEPSQVIDAKLKVDSLIFLAEEGGAIVGAVMAGYDGHRGWVYAVAVDASARRKGIGSALVREAIAALEQLGCIKVNLQVRSSNSSVVSFYESLGWRCCRRSSTMDLPDRRVVIPEMEDAKWETQAKRLSDFLFVLPALELSLQADCPAMGTFADRDVASGSRGLADRFG